MEVVCASTEYDLRKLRSTQQCWWFRSYGILCPVDWQSM